MTIYRLSHYYSNYVKDFYGVKTALTLHELNIRCAYLQLLHLELPLLLGAENTLDESSGVALLRTLYDIEPVYECQNYLQALNLYDNWNEYCGGRLENYVSEIRQVAKPGAFKRLLEIKIIDCRVTISRYLSGEIEPDNPDRWLSTLNKNIVRLQQLVDGGSVESEWGWRTIGEPSCTGRVYVRNNDKPDLPSVYTG